MAKRAAGQAAFLIREAIAANGSAVVAVSVDALLGETLAALAAEADVDWAKVELFPVGGYVGLNADQAATSAGELASAFLDKLPVPPAAVRAVDAAAADAEAECRRLIDLLGGRAIDLILCGVGDDGALTLESAPADLDAESAYRPIPLGDGRRRRLVEQGLFAKRSETPRAAAAMTVRQILSATAVVCPVPGEDAADAVAAVVEGAVTPDVPASILQQHANVTLFLDEESSRLVK